jgi:hypothetical protein
LEIFNLVEESRPSEDAATFSASGLQLPLGISKKGDMTCDIEVFSPY